MLVCWCVWVCVRVCVCVCGEQTAGLQLFSGNILELRVLQTSEQMKQMQYDRSRASCWNVTTARYMECSHADVGANPPSAWFVSVTFTALFQCLLFIHNMYIIIQNIRFENNQGHTHVFHHKKVKMFSIHVCLSMSHLWDRLFVQVMSQPNSIQCMQRQAKLL